MTAQEIPNSSSLTLMGVLLIIFGVICIATPAVAGTAVVMVIGIVMVAAGAVQIVSGLRTEGWFGKLPPLILGVLALICGLGLLGKPWIGMSVIALLLAIFFVMEGLWKVFVSFSYRPASGWLMMLASGIITLVLGLMIWNQWPVSGLWAVGILVGVDLLMTGVSMLALASTVRHFRKSATPSGAA